MVGRADSADLRIKRWQELQCCKNDWRGVDLHRCSRCIARTFIIVELAPIEPLLRGKVVDAKLTTGRESLLVDPSSEFETRLSKFIQYHHPFGCDMIQSQVAVVSASSDNTNLLFQVSL